MRWMITGANGHLGQRLIAELLSGDLSAETSQVEAVVRSARAAQSLGDLGLDESAIHVVDYEDEAALHEIAVNCDVVVHLVGILKASARARYEAAHERSCETLVAALADTPVRHITYLSIVGSKPSAQNACLRSKGAAEEILERSPIAACTLQVPMVVGEGDYAAAAINGAARKSTNIGFRMASLEQPIYAGDVVRAIIGAARNDVKGRLLLGGPEVLSRAALYIRAANRVGTTTRIVSLPIGPMFAVCGLMERFMVEPPMTRAMLEVLDQDDVVDPAVAMEALGIDELTSVDQMLSQIGE